MKQLIALQFDQFNYKMDRSQWQKSLFFLQDNIAHLQQSLASRLQRYVPFRNIFLEILKACEKFAGTLSTISDICDQDLLSTLTQTEESLASYYLTLRSGLLGIAETWRQVAIRSKNQILEPLKVFSDNYKKVATEAVSRLKENLNFCLTIEQNIIKNRQSYYSCCEKLQRHKEGQAKIMMKIENGQPGELEKFNKTTKSLLERVGSSQRKYMDSVQRANQETKKMRSLIEKQMINLRNTETARVQFLKKVSTSQLKVFELGKSINLNFKPVSSLVKIQGKGRSQFSEFIQKIEYFSKGNVMQIYISHEELIKSKRHKEFEQQNPFLMQLFNKVKENQKKSLVQFVHGCLEIESACQLISIQKTSKFQYKMVFPPEWQTFREKILSLQHYLFYFAFLLNRQLNELPNYYVKLSAPFFQHLVNLLLAILDKIEMSVQGAMGQAAIGISYKILKLAERVVLKKDGKRAISNMKILIESLGQCKRLREEKILCKLYKYLIKKGHKKQTQSKGVMGFTKGLFSTFSSKKQENSSTQEEQFNALVELTHIMANLSLPTQIVLPFLKNLLKNNGEASYQYLKDILQGRRDRQERQKLVLEEDPKNKLSNELKVILQQNKKAETCLKIVASKGFFDLSALELRLCSRELVLVHLDIIYRLPVSFSNKLRCVTNPSVITRYREDIEKVTQNEKRCEIEDIIVLDVNRSLHLHVELPRDLLKRFLIYYARQHDHMQYCQGMNYLAGYILLKTDMHQSSYAIFCSIMQKYFIPIFINSFDGMKLKLYLFDRLLSIFHPDLSDHFKRQMITPQCYAVGWVITAFTSVYQYTQRSILVDLLWTRFAIWGWKQFYKITMWLLNLNRDVLLSAGYDGCLQILGEMTKSQIMTEADQESFRNRWGNEFELIQQAFPVSDKLIQRLTAQFSHE